MKVQEAIKHYGKLFEETLEAVLESYDTHIPVVAVNEDTEAVVKFCAHTVGATLRLRN